MATGYELTAELREDKGKGASRRLRRTGKVPAVIYGGNKEARAITVDHTRLAHALENEAFYSHILKIKVGDKEQAAVLKDLQRHPAKRQIVHVDFMRVLDDQKIRMTVPLHFLNEEVSVGVKQQGGVVSHLRSDVEVSCLPRDLPEYLDIDVAEVELDGVLNLSDIKLPEGVELPDLSHGEESQDHPILNISRARMVEVDEEETEGEVGGEGEAAPDAPEAGTED